MRLAHRLLGVIIVGMDTLQDSDFRQQVYRLVEQVPAGKVTTYGQLAAMIPPPTGADPAGFSRIGAQWVGRAMRLAPEHLAWHRVINSQGKISLPAASRSGAIQRMRLEAEGIEFDRQGRVDLGRFGWEGPPADWLHEHGYLLAPSMGRARPAQLSLFDDPAYKP